MCKKKTLYRQGSGILRVRYRFI